MCVFLSDLLHSIWSSLGPFMLLPIAWFHSFVYGWVPKYAWNPPLSAPSPIPLMSLGICYFSSGHLQVFLHWFLYPPSLPPQMPSSSITASRVMDLKCYYGSSAHHECFHSSSSSARVFNTWEFDESDTALSSEKYTFTLTHMFANFDDSFREIHQISRVHPRAPKSKGPQLRPLATKLLFFLRPPLSPPPAFHFMDWQSSTACGPLCTPHCSLMFFSLKHPFFLSLLR